MYFIKSLKGANYLIHNIDIIDFSTCITSVNDSINWFFITISIKLTSDVTIHSLRTSERNTDHYNKVSYGLYHIKYRQVTFY